jgi:hypothetical protein
LSGSLAHDYYTLSNISSELMAVAIERGAQAVREDGKGFASIMWETWSPKGWFEGDTFGRVAVPFENPDWVDIRFRMPSTDAHIGQLGLQDSHGNDHH